MRLRWPWTSVARLDDLATEIAWLRERVAFLEDRIERRQRFELGMPEAPREQKVVRTTMPAELAQYIRGFANPQLRRMQMVEAIRRNNAGESWDSIKAEVMDEKAPDIRQALSG
jgi:hypothetical protein